MTLPEFYLIYEAMRPKEENEKLAGTLTEAQAEELYQMIQE